MWPGIVDPNKNTSILISSVGTEPKKIKKGQILGVINSCISLQNNDQDNIPTEKTEWTVDDLKKNINLDHLSPEQREMVYNAFSDVLGVFSTSESDIGRARVTEHQIELLDHTPIYQRPRRFPEPISNEIDRQCKELLAADIIEPSKSSWNSPIVPVKKKNSDSIRLCIDFKNLML